MTYRKAAKLKPGLDRVREKYTDQILTVEKLDMTLFCGGADPILTILCRNKYGVSAYYSHHNLEAMQ